MCEDVSVYFCLYMFFFFLEENASCSFFYLSGVTIDLGCPRKSQFTPVCLRSPFTCRTLQFNWWIIWSHYPFISPFTGKPFQIALLYSLSFFPFMPLPLLCDYPHPTSLLKWFLQEYQGSLYCQIPWTLLVFINFGLWHCTQYSFLQHFFFLIFLNFWNNILPRVFSFLSTGLSLLTLPGFSASFLSVLKILLCPKILVYWPFTFFSLFN